MSQRLFRILLTFVLLGVSLSSMAAASAPMELWLWSHGYITSASAVQQNEVRIDEAASEGYTGIVFWDSSFSFMAAPFWTQQNVAYLQQVVNYAESKGLKVTATVAPYGASQDALQNNPNWAESQRVVGTQFQVSADGTKLQQISDFAGLQNSGLENGQSAWFRMNDAGVSVDCTTSHTGSCSALIQNAPNNARLVQSFAVHPWRQYHIRFWYKSQGCGGCNPNIYVYDAQNTNMVRYNASFNANGGQGWTEIDYTINSQASTQLLMYLGNWGGNTGSLWFDDISAEETDLIFLTRRPGTPIKMYNPQNPATVYQEGTDFNYIKDPPMDGRNPFTNLWHTPPIITLPSTTTLKPGQVVALDSYAVTMLPDDQVAMCFTEQGTLDWQKSNAQAIHAMLPADAGLMMQYDEIRQMNSCGSCRAKGLTAGQLLAEHVQQSTNLYQSVHPGPWLYVWSDMFDPFHNARDNYYYAEGDLSGSWEGLSSGVSIMNWNLGNLTNSLTWFSGLNAAQPTPHQQMIAGYYDNGNGTWSAQTELAQAAGIPGITGLMYTTWQGDYSQMAQFAAAARAAWPYYVASLAPSRGSVNGIVTDASGTAVPGATVSLSNGTLTWTVTTDGSGAFSFNNVPSGTYTLQITSFGYNSYSNTSVTVPTSGTPANGDSSSTSPNSNTVNLTIPLSQPSTFPSIRIKGGGAAITDEQGNQWLADSNYDAGASAAPAGVTVSSTLTPSLYASQHYNSGNFTYNFAVPNGNYYLTLKFAELYHNGPKQRLFSILVNGNMVDQNLDVFTAAGGQNRAYDLKLPIVVSNHAITIQFQAVIDNPVVNAIEIDAADSTFVLPGNITGQVLNYEGQTVPDATVTLSNGNTTLTTTTDNSGNFSFWALPAGTYTVQGSGLGYASSSVMILPITAGTTATATVTLPQPPTALPIRIKCGSQSLTDETGNLWVSDLGLYDYGSQGATSNSIANTTTPSVYQSERWMSGPMTYRIPVPNGTYNLVLKFSELYWSAPNQRVFNVVVNGVVARQNLDVFAAAGGAYTAYDMTVPVSVTNQWVTVEFDPIVNNPKIDAIELDPLQVGPSTITGTIQNIALQGVAGAVVWVTSHSYRRSATSDASGRFTISNLAPGTYTVQATASGYIPYTAWAVQANPAASTTLTVPLIATDPSFTPLHLNSGGPALVDHLQQSWLPDDGYYQYGSVGFGSADISNVANPEIYQLQRWMSGNLNYNFNLPNGNYMVILKFAETYFNSPGQRVVNVILNGTTAVPNFDAFKAAGGANLAYDLQIPVTISNGFLNVQLQQVIQNPSLAAIDIEAILPGAIAAVSPQALTFGSQQLGVSGTAQSLTVSNPGSAPLSIASFSITGADPADFTLQNNCGATLAVHAQCTVQVTFQPLAVGSRSAVLMLQSNVGSSSVALSGTAFGTPQAVLSTTALNFGSIALGTVTPAQTVTISNLQGIAALSISSIVVTGANPGDFTIPNSCNSSIAAGSSCSLSVQFTPAALGPRQATLIINDNANPTPQIVVLTGNGGTPAQALKIMSRSSGKALDLTGSSLADGALAEQWDYWGGDNQQWFLIALGNGYYEIQNKLSQKALGIVNASAADGALLEQRQYRGADSQQWILTPSADGYYKITNKASLKVLEVLAFSTDNGTDLDQWRDTGGTNQLWIIQPAAQATTSSTSGAATGTTPDPTSIIPNNPGCTVLSFAAGPNPIYTSSTYGLTTVSANVTCPYDIRVSSSNGALFATGNGYSSTLTGNWVSTGLKFYLQKSGDTTAAGTLAPPITMQLKPGTPGLACLATAFSASPNPIVTKGAFGQTTITAITNCSFDIRIGSPSGPEFHEGRGHASFLTGVWVTNGMTVYLQPHGDTDPTDTLASLKLVVQSPPTGCDVTSFSSPTNPIVTTTRLNELTLDASATCTYDVRIGSPSGGLLGTGSNSASFHTGPWVTNGMTFFLQLAGNTTANGTLSTLTINTKLPDQKVSTCTIANFSADNNPLVAADSVGHTTININASCAWDLRLNDSAGALLSSASGSASIPATNIADGTAFYLQPHNDTNYIDTLSVLTVAVKSQASSGCQVSVFDVSPIQADSSFGISTISASATCPYDIRVGGPDGLLFGSGVGFTSANTGNWVIFGEQFFLQRRDDTTSAGTLAIRTAIIIP